LFLEIYLVWNKGMITGALTLIGTSTPSSSVKQACRCQYRFRRVFGCARQVVETANKSDRISKPEPCVPEKEPEVRLDDLTPWRVQSYIDGKWTPAVDGGVLDVYNPAIYEILDTVPKCGTKETSVAIPIHNCFSSNKESAHLLAP